MAGELVVADQQIQLRDWLGGPSGGVGDWIDEVLNWWGSAPVRNRDVPRMSTDGVQGGIDLLGSKTLTGKMLIVGTSAADLRARLDAVQTAWLPSSDNLPLVVMLLGEKRRRYGRPRRFEVEPKLATYFSTQGIYAAVVLFQFDALDPFVYSDTEHSVAIGLSVPGGFTAPFTAPFTLTAGSGGVGSVVNAGTVPAPWTGRLDGPLTNPAIIHQGQSRTLDFDVNGGLTLGASEFLLLDSRARSALLNGTADRRNTLDLGSRWFDLDPGSNAIALAADSGSGSFTISWRDAYP